nr:hypothetical protein [Mycobacterium celatum]
MLGGISRRPCAASDSSLTLVRNRFGQRSEPDARAPKIDVLGIADGTRRQISLVVPLELGSVKLSSTLETPDPIGEHRELLGVGVTGDNRSLQQFAAAPLEIGPADRMLRDPEGRIGSVLANAGDGGPTIFEQLLEPVGVAVVDLLHRRVIAVEHRTIGSKAGPNRIVLGDHL